MREVISNTSPLQYLFQAELLDLLPALYGTVVVPSGVVAELAEGRARGVSLPDPTLLPWTRVREIADPALLRIAADLDRGEREVLAIAKQSADQRTLFQPLWVLFIRYGDNFSSAGGGRIVNISLTEREKTLHGPLTTNQSGNPHKIAVISGEKFTARL